MVCVTYDTKYKKLRVTNSNSKKSTSILYSSSFFPFAFAFFSFYFNPFSFYFRFFLFPSPSPLVRLPFEFTSLHHPALLYSEPPTKRPQRARRRQRPRRAVRRPARASWAGPARGGGGAAQRVLDERRVGRAPAVRPSSPVGRNNFFFTVFYVCLIKYARER